MPLLGDALLGDICRAVHVEDGWSAAAPRVELALPECRHLGGGGLEHRDGNSFPRVSEVGPLQTELRNRQVLNNQPNNGCFDPTLVMISLLWRQNFYSS